MIRSPSSRRVNVVAFSLGFCDELRHDYRSDNRCQRDDRNLLMRPREHENDREQHGTRGGEPDDDVRHAIGKSVGIFVLVRSHD